MKPASATTRAVAAWGKAMPDWIAILARACDETSQAKAALAIGYKPATVSLVIRNQWPADLSRVETAVRGAFMSATVPCPVLGEIATTRCLHEQRQPFSNSSHDRVRLFRECRRPCPFSSKGASA